MAVQLAFVGRDYERAADHAVMIGRWVEFMVTGELPGDRRRQPALTAGPASLTVASVVHLPFNRRQGPGHPPFLRCPR